MSRKSVTNCDCCKEEIKLYHGAVVDILEYGGNRNRVEPDKDRILADLCDECYEPLAKVLKSMRLAGGEAVTQEKLGRT